MPKKQKRKYTKRAKTTKPLTISIHGEGVDIDATFDGTKGGSNLTDIIASLAKQVMATRAPSEGTDGATAPIVGPADALDLMKNIIDDCDPETLSVIDQLVVDRLDKLNPTQPNATA